MNAELRNQTLVAAESARQQGFEKTYEALLALIREMEQREAVAKSPIDHSSA